MNLTSPSEATIGDGQGVGTIQNDDTVQTTIAALVDQVGQVAGLDRDIVRDLLELLVGAQRRILSPQRADVIEELRDFSAIVRELGRARGQGRAPRLDSLATTDNSWICVDCKPYGYTGGRDSPGHPGMKDGQVFKKDGVMTPAAFFHGGPVNGWRIR